jgi:hypothetical protein
MKSLLEGSTGIHCSKGVPRHQRRDHAWACIDNAKAIEELGQPTSGDLRPSGHRPPLRIREQRAAAVQGPHRG